MEAFIAPCGTNRRVPLLPADDTSRWRANRRSRVLVFWTEPRGPVIEMRLEPTPRARHVKRAPLPAGCAARPA